MEMFVECAIRCVKTQKITLGRDPASAIRFRRVGLENQIQRPTFECRYAVVIHGGLISQGGHLRQRFGSLKLPANSFEAPNPLHIQVEKVAIEDAVRQVWTDVVRTPVVDRVQRIKSDEIHMKSRQRPIDEIGEIAKITTAPVPARPQPVKGDAQAGMFAGFRQMSAVRRNDQPHRAITGPRLVIPERQFNGGIGDTVLYVNLMLFTVFRDNLHIEIARNTQGIVFADHQHGRKRTRALSLLTLRHGSEQRFLRRTIEAKRRQDRAIGFRLRKMTVAEDVPEVLLYTIPLGGIAECGVE